jgi:hypothetical protein
LRGALTDGISSFIVFRRLAQSAAMPASIQGRAFFGSRNGDRVISERS